MQISVQPESAFAEIAFDNIEFVDTALGVITMFRRKEKVPLPAISQNCQLHTFVKCIFEQLPFCAVTLTNILHLDKGNRLTWRMAKCIVNSSSFETVLWTDRLRVVSWPAERIQ